MRKKLAVVMILGCLLCSLTGCESWGRYVKTIKSDVGGGLNRKVTVYDYMGNEIKSYEGKFDVQESESKVYFDDQNGKRVIIYNALVINEEK